MATKPPKPYTTLSSLLLSLLLLTTFPCKSKSQANQQEKQILLQLKHSWGNPSSLSSWNNSTTTPHCTWTGIQCDTTSSITTISLPSQNITLPIPPSICNLKSLSHLDLSNNSIPGPFPTTLYNCSNLQYIDLSQNLFIGNIPFDIDSISKSLFYLSLSANNFTGNIPTSIGRLPNIQTLLLDNNLFNGTFPAEFGNLSSIETLWLANNPFAPSSIPSEFGNMSKLSDLWMTATNLMGSIPKSFARLENLEHLDLAENSLTGGIPDGIWMLKNWQYLYLYKNSLSGNINSTIKAASLIRIDVSINQLTGSIPEGFGKLQNLSILLMYFNRFSGEIPASIGLLPSLTDLRLFNNSLTGVLPPELGKHSELWNLEVDDNMITGELPQNLCAQGALSSIVVFNNNLTGNIPASLGDCATLDNIQIQRNGFSGDLPSGIWSAVNLSTVILRDNSLSGTLPKELPWNLTRLDIQNNRFSGNIPSSGSNLLVFLASNNLFSGNIPNNLAGISNLQSLSIGGNLITGTIPAAISDLKFLTDLNLSSNQLEGEIPASIGSLPVLTSLDLSYNQLSGKIPAVFGNLKLNYLNLSSNQLSGMIPLSLQNQAYAKSFLSNPDLCLSMNNCGDQYNGSDKLSYGLRIMFIVLGAVFLLIVAVSGLLIARDYKKRKNCGDLTSWKLTSFHSLDFTESSIVKGLSEDNLIGSGGSGKVYRVTIRNRAGEIVAVKKIYNSRNLDCKLEKEFQSEVQILGSIRHMNIVKLLCCISSVDSMMLVYEFMGNGSLYRWLHEKRRVVRDGLGRHESLDWPTRLGIAIGAARGLSYMHHDCCPAIVHRDVKSSNILLDSKFRAKIADFGLARILVKEGEPGTASAVAGSFGYMAPECAYTRKVNEKMDVYSFGVVLLELTTGREASDGEEQGGLADWAWRHFQEGKKAMDAIDESIKDPTFLGEIGMVLKLGLICTGTLPSTRPSMKDVLEILLRCDQTPGIDKTQVEHDIAPLLQIKRGSRHKRPTGTEEDEECSNLACNV